MGDVAGLGLFNAERSPVRFPLPSSSFACDTKERTFMSKVGAFTFVLHSHLPYARQSGMWTHGEEWVHEAMAETYVPLLDALNDLVDEGVPFALTIGITPILAE